MDYIEPTVADFSMFPMAAESRARCRQRTRCAKQANYWREASLISGDFEVVVKDVRKGDFVYLDPPFSETDHRTFTQYGAQPFGERDLTRLRTVMKNVDAVGATFLLSYADCVSGRKLSEDYQTLVVSTRRNIAGFAGHRRSAAELIVTNQPDGEGRERVSGTEDSNGLATADSGGELIRLKVDDLRPSPHNPRKLFDKEPLEALRRSIREHGVLVPLTVYRLPGQDMYAIVDGERRYRCCRELAAEGVAVSIPANVVQAPDTMASLIYMFNIHQFREQWELMPTAIALRSVIEELGTEDDRELSEVTGLSERQVERCKTILAFGKVYQDLSMNPDPAQRIPSNFWVELSPVLQLTAELLPSLVVEQGREGITDRFIEKYRRGNVKSVIHFRRILEAHDVQEGGKEGVEAVADRLREYILSEDMETRAAFDGFIVDTRRVERAAQAADTFVAALRRAKVEHAVDEKGRLIGKLTMVLEFVEALLARLEGEDAPPEDVVEGP